ncbi:hypothetical protein XI06_27270 [Bradyrhizobium sp. CCBAU 11434]|nr:hypothetical protein [Bradyrhizobium sp. CCBAU 11434]
MRIPPGYKDGKKLQGGPGDLLIWKTILAEGKSRNKDCVFVSAEEKPDWWVRNSGAFQPRVELIEEYRSTTGGRTVHIVTLSKLLEIFGVPEDAVKNVRKAEEANTANWLAATQNTANWLATTQALQSLPQRSRGYRGSLERRIRMAERRLLELGDPETASPEQRELIADLTLRRRSLLRRMEALDRAAEAREEEEEEEEK